MGFRSISAFFTLVCGTFTSAAFASTINLNVQYDLTATGSAFNISSGSGFNLFTEVNPVPSFSIQNGDTVIVDFSFLAGQRLRMTGSAGTGSTESLSFTSFPTGTVIGATNTLTFFDTDAAFNSGSSPFSSGSFSNPLITNVNGNFTDSVFEFGGGQMVSIINSGLVSPTTFSFGFMKLFSSGTMDAYEVVTVSEVPEPAVPASLAFGLLGIWITRRRNGLRISLWSRLATLRQGAEMFKNAKLRACVSVIAVLAFTTSANAGTIIGGSGILTTGYVNQLETWLGEGPLALTNIFTKGITGNSSTDWHSAVDNRGRTFSVFEATVNGTSHILGGYNPQSWNSTNAFSYTSADADRTAFIFNLTDSVIQRQCVSTGPATCGLDNFDIGNEQSYNWDAYGPTFGGGHDFRITGALSTGYLYNFSYDIDGGQVGYGWGTNNISGELCTGVGCMTIGNLETFTIAVGETPQVPAPGALALFGFGFLILRIARRKYAV